LEPAGPGGRARPAAADPPAGKRDDTETSRRARVGVQKRGNLGNAQARKGGGADAQERGKPRSDVALRHAGARPGIVRHGGGKNRPRYRAAVTTGDLLQQPKLMGRAAEIQVSAEPGKSRHRDRQCSDGHS
jgi:hypothetical protein